MKAIRVDDKTHTQFKAACALRGMPMSEAVKVALRMLMDLWHAQDAERKAQSEQAQEHKRQESAFFHGSSGFGVQRPS